MNHSARPRRSRKPAAASGSEAEQHGADEGAEQREAGGGELGALGLEGERERAAEAEHAGEDAQPAARLRRGAPPSGGGARRGRRPRRRRRRPAPRRSRGRRCRRPAARSRRRAAACRRGRAARVETSAAAAPPRRAPRRSRAAPRRTRGRRRAASRRRARPRPRDGSVESTIGASASAHDGARERPRWSDAARCRAKRSSTTTAEPTNSSVSTQMPSASSDEEGERERRRPPSRARRERCWAAARHARSGRMYGKSSTSRRCGASHEHHHDAVDARRRGRPVGGMPCSSATQEVLVERLRLLVAGGARRARCSSKRARWSSGSLSSLKALASSMPPTKSSKRSTSRGSLGRALRERRELDRVVGQEGRLHERRLDVLAEELVDELAPGRRVAGIEAGCARAACAQRGEVRGGEHVDAGRVADRVARWRRRGHSPPSSIACAAEGERACRPSRSRTTCWSSACDQLHHVAVVGVGLVALHHRELGVVLARRRPRCGSRGRSRRRGRARRSRAASGRARPRCAGRRPGRRRCSGS